LRFPAYLLLPAVWALNAAAEGLTEEIFLADLPQVLTASRIATSPLDAPAPVSVIDRETIRALGFTEIHDLLAPGAGLSGGGLALARGCYGYVDLTHASAGVLLASIGA